MVPTPTPYYSEFGDCCPLSVPIGNDPLLAGIQSLGTAKLLALLPCSLDALVGALADQATLKFSNTAHDGQHQPAGIGRGVAPALPSDTKPQERPSSSCTMLCRSRLERATRSSFVTTTVSPGSSTFCSLVNSVRPWVDLPDAFSLKIRRQLWKDAGHWR
jgi:hypothetical protein